MKIITVSDIRSVRLRGRPQMGWIDGVGLINQTDTTPTFFSCMGVCVCVCVHACVRACVRARAPSFCTTL